MDAFLKSAELGISRIHLAQGLWWGFTNLSLPHRVAVKMKSSNVYEQPWRITTHWPDVGGGNGSGYNCDHGHHHYPESGYKEEEKSLISVWITCPLEMSPKIQTHHLGRINTHTNSMPAWGMLTPRPQSYLILPSFARAHWPTSVVGIWGQFLVLIHQAILKLSGPPFPFSKGWKGWKIIANHSLYYGLNCVPVPQSSKIHKLKSRPLLSQNMASFGHRNLTEVIVWKRGHEDRT